MIQALRMLAASAPALSPMSTIRALRGSTWSPIWLLIEVLLQGTYGIRKKHRTYLATGASRAGRGATIGCSVASSALLRDSSGCWRAC